LAAGVALMAGQTPARAQAAGEHKPRAQTADDPARKADRPGNKVEDAWILTKVKAKFVGEDALKHSDIDVDVQHGVVTLKGTVASAAGRQRAMQIARDTDGVVRVVDRLAIGTAKRGADEAVGTSGRAADRTSDAKASTGTAAHSTKHTLKHSTHTATHTGRHTGEAVTDSWITTKVKSSFVGVDALDGSKIDVDTNDHVVTLHGTVRTEAGREKAASLARKVKGVTSVKNELKVRR
jgi:osmotically-inducible protein OsmY